MKHSVNLTNGANRDFNNNKTIIDADVEHIPATMDISNKILQDGKKDIATTSIDIQIDKDNSETLEHASDVVKINLETINRKVFEKIDMYAKSLEVANHMANDNPDVDETLSFKSACLETSSDIIESLNDSFVTAKCMETFYDSMESLNFQPGYDSSSFETDSDDSMLVSEQHSTKSQKTNSETCPKNNDKLIIFDNRSKCEIFLKRLCAANACVEYKVVAELLNFPDEIEETEEARANTIIETNAIRLMYLMNSATLDDAGISPGNTRYYSFMEVLKNYIKIHAVKKFIGKIETVLPVPLLKTEKENKLMFEVADELLNVSLIYHKLCKSLANMDYLNEISAYRVFLEVRPYLTSGVLRGLMLARVSRVFLSVVSTKSFLHLTEHEVVHLIQNSYLSVNSEIEILLSIILWLEHTWFRRKYQAQYVLSAVRFNLLPLWYFTTMEYANKCYHYARVIKMPFVRQMLQKGFEEAQILRAKAKVSAAVKQIPVPLPRDWVADPNTPHHHKQHCKYFEYPTFDVFKKYLKNTVSNVPDYWCVLRPALEVYRNTLQCCAPTSFT